MKRYHQVAHFVEGDKITGMWLHDEQGTTDFYVNDKEFIELVKQGEVQYFVWNESTNNVDIQYTAEELKDMGKQAKYAESHQSLEHHFRNNFRFSQEHYDLCKDRGIIQALVANTMRVPAAGPTVILVLIGTPEAYTKFYEQIPKVYRKAIRPLKGFGSNTQVLVIPATVLRSMQKAGLDSVLISTYFMKDTPEGLTIEAMANTSKSAKKFIRSTASDNAAILSICNDVNEFVMNKEE